MTLSNREVALIVAAVAVGLAGLTFVLGRNRFDQWQQMQSERQNLMRQITLNQRLVDQREEWAARLAASKDQLPAYPSGVDVTPKLLEALEELARTHGVKLNSISNDKESQLGEVSEVAIKCSWQADLEQCVRFLYALQSANGMYKVRSLSIAPTGSDGQLKGTFVLDCAYLRSGSSAGSPLQEAPLPSPSAG